MNINERNRIYRRLMEKKARKQLLPGGEGDNLNPKDVPSKALARGEKADEDDSKFVGIKRSKEVMKKEAEFFGMNLGGGSKSKGEDDEEESEGEKEGKPDSKKLLSDPDSRTYQGPNMSRGSANYSFDGNTPKSDGVDDEDDSQTSEDFSKKDRMDYNNKTKENSGSAESLWRGDSNAV